MGTKQEVEEDEIEVTNEINVEKIPEEMSYKHIITVPENMDQKYDLITTNFSLNAVENDIYQTMIDESIVPSLPALENQQESTKGLVTFTMDISETSEPNIAIPETTAPVIDVDASLLVPVTDTETTAPVVDVVASLPITDTETTSPVTDLDASY